MQINYELMETELRLQSITPLFERLAQQTEKILNVTEDFVVSIIFTTSKDIQTINREYRQIDQPTDVISFAMLDSIQIEGEEISQELGDIFINTEYAEKQAIEYDHTLEREYAFLFVHGLLHLFGYDHMTQEEEREMFQLQDQILDPIIKRES